MFFCKIHRAKIFLVDVNVPAECQGNFTPLHSLTGPVGQPFASRLGGQLPGDEQTHNRTGFLRLTLSRYTFKKLPVVEK